jgi:regulator of replication initiation timing
MNEEIKEKLEKLKEYEAQERTQKRWQPYKEMKKELLHMYDCKKHLCEAAHFQDVAEEICSDYGLELYTNGTACMWDALEELEKQIGAKEKEFEELYRRLKEEE